MTIAELLERTGLAFERTYHLVGTGAFGDVVLLDLGIIVATGFVGLVAWGMIMLIILIND